jgi:hypothetical protein
MRNVNRGRRYVLGYALAMIVGVTIICGCASISTFQSARTLKQGETQKGVGVTLGNPWISESWGERGVQELRVDKSPVLPWLEFWLRKGLSQNLDWGIKTWGPFFGAIADLKYQFLSDESPWQLAGSLGLGFSFRLESLEEGVSFFDLYLPFYISRDLGKSCTFYISPKYIHRATLGAYPTVPNRQSNAFGAGLGISFPLSSRFLIRFLPIFGELDLGSIMVEYDCVYEKGTVVGFTHNWGVGFVSKIKKRKN